MVGLKTTVIGLKDLNANLKNIVQSVGPPEAAKIMLEGAEVIAELTKANIQSRGLVDTGNLMDSVEAIKVNQFAAGVRVSAIYAAVHEYGLPDQPITERQRRFFWAMWIDTEKEMWKALALSETYTIPARPYLRPAVDEGRHKAIKAIAQETERRIAGAV